MTSRFCSVTLILAVWSVVAAGCSDPAAPRCHKVSGRVLLNDQPLAEALVVFHPLGVPPKEAPKPMAHTNEEGRFELTTLMSGDGAQVGEYAVTIELREPRTVGEEVVRDGPNLLPARYANPQFSELRYSVVAGKNEVPPLVLYTP